jgi:hypothetical protein
LLYWLGNFARNAVAAEILTVSRWVLTVAEMVTDGPWWPILWHVDGHEYLSAWAIAARCGAE